MSDTVRHVSAFVERHHQELRNTLILSHELDGGETVVPFPDWAREFSLLFPDRRRPTQPCIESVRELWTFPGDKGARDVELTTGFLLVQTLSLRRYITPLLPYAFVVCTFTSLYILGAYVITDKPYVYKNI
jgi:hypothetical protein